MSDGNSVAKASQEFSCDVGSSINSLMKYPAAGFDPHSLSGGTSRSAASFNNMRSERFYTILQTIQHMSRVPYGHPVHIDANVAEHAIDVVAALNHHFEVPPPKIFPMDDENLVLEWTIGPVGRYLTLSAEDLSILEKNLKTNIKCLHELSPDGEKGYQSLRLFLDAPLANGVTTTVDNAE